MEKTQALADKVGVIKPGKCCTNCKHGKGSKCVLFDIFIYPGSYCDSFEEDSKREKNKITRVERRNKEWTVDRYLSEKGLDDVEVILTDLYPLLSKATVTRVDKTLTDYGYDTNITKVGRTLGRIFHNIYLIDKNGNKQGLWSSLIDYQDAEKLYKAFNDYLYDSISAELASINP